MDINTNKIDVLTEIKGFLEGYNSDIKYLVNVETNRDTNYAECIIHEPGEEPSIRRIGYNPFMYMKDVSKLGLELYGNNPELMQHKQQQYGVTITKLKTGNQKRLVDGYCYKLTSTKSFSAIVNFLREGKINPYEKLTDADGELVRDFKGEAIYKYRDIFYNVTTTEQFLISKQSRLYKGFEHYNDVHRVTFDIETTGLRHQMSRIFAIGVRDTRGFETILEIDKWANDASEIRLIQDFFNLVIFLKPAIISGYHSEMFDFEFILGRAKILGMNLEAIKTTLNDNIGIKRRANVSVKYGNTSDKYTATEMWGISVIDTLHAAKKTAAINTEIKETKLKYIAKYENIAKPNRTYIQGEDSGISNMYIDNLMHVCDTSNNYLQIPTNHQEVGMNMYKLQANKERISEVQYNNLKTQYLDSNPEFVNWFRNEPLPKGMTTFITGKKLLKQYLLDDLWETEKVDELYNQSSFMLAKIVPTTFHRVCTMGTASVWNLLLTAWSFEQDLAIPHSDVKEKFSGGLARCYRRGFSKRWVKIDYASLYPMVQLTHDIFPFFDITGVIKKMLLYLTTTRNIYKKLANADELNEEEIYILKEVDNETYKMFINGEITDKNRAMFKTKQLPIKILNNSLFGALGSDRSFNWSDNVCASRITCIGRLRLRQAVKWYIPYGCIPLLAVTDGINFQIPEFTKIKLVQGSENVILDVAIPIEEAWQYNGKTGIGALIDKFNAEEMIAPFMAVDNDGEFVSCLNLSRINYATLQLVKDKKRGGMKEKVKLTGNTIKSKVMPEYVQDFFDKGLELILHGKGKEFIDYYYDYVNDIFYKQIPYKKIASKSKVKTSIKAYQNRGKDKNGREKGKQAYMELLIEKRDRTAEELFQKHKSELTFTKDEAKLTINDKLKLVADYMPPEPELDSVVYVVNNGYIQSQGDSKMIKDKETGEERYASMIITSQDLKDNPNLTGYYNVPKYLAGFNKRIKPILVGFDPEVVKGLLSKIKKPKKKDEVKVDSLLPDKNYFTSDKQELLSFEADNIEDSMILEPKEVEFWNRSGYDPRKMWDGFEMNENDKVYFEIYENALNYLNEKMIKQDMPLIKSVDDKYLNGDLVLIKKDNVFSVGSYNGTFLNIIRENVEVPKMGIELDWEAKRLLNLEKAALVAAANEADGETVVDPKRELQLKYFNRFKTKYKITADVDLDTLLGLPGAIDAFDEFLEEFEVEEDIEETEDIDVDTE